MTDRNDYEGDMPIRRLSDREVEQLLTGRSQDNEVLAPLASLVEALRTAGRPFVTEEAIRGYAAEAAEAVRAAQPGPPAHVPPEKVLPRPGRTMLKLRAKSATFLAAAFLAVGTTGVAWAANGADPGDGLYGVDLALEQVGIFAGGASERLEEAAHLVQNGRAAEALNHAALAVTQAEPNYDEDADLSNALAALEAAAARVSEVGQNDEDGLAVYEEVAALLAYIQANVGPEVGADGRDFGQGVADLARQIGGDADHQMPDLSDIPPVDLPEQAGTDLPDTDAEGGGPPFDVPVGGP